MNKEKLQEAINFLREEWNKMNENERKTLKFQLIGLKLITPWYSDNIEKWNEIEKVVGKLY